MKIFTSVFALFFIFIATFFQAQAGFSDFFQRADTIPYCNDIDGEDCGLDQGIEQVERINGIERERSFSEYIQDVVVYLLTFLAIIAVVLIIYAGFNVLTAAGDEEKAKKSKSIIIYAVIGIVIIFLAFPLSEFIFSILGLRELPSE